ncbi:Ig-specific serine endopeptidase MIP [Mesomycoplasma ovipneumoniae]|uniref:Ig-specific serine endopeptidase MIP n=1 Tax=Mesomycoplasma ovipneumoniae TaxID=29562 RepID=UPI0028ADB812|nr:DUF31 family protein [Mesomycoplasma ovipneumoniae]WNM15430.1 DUF31 family protein [Mesomycoplasma ovipneumoniae]
MKIKFLFPLLTVPFFAIACGSNQQQKLPSEQNQQSQKTPPTEGNFSSSPETELVFQKINSNFESLFGQKSENEFKKFISESQKSVFQLLDNNVKDLSKKQEKINQINNIFSALEKIATQTQYDLEAQRSTAILTLGALKDIFKEEKPTQQQPPNRPQNPQSSEERDKKIAELISNSRPSGQNFSRFSSDGKRTILDQYENDFPEKEWDWYRINSTFSGGGIGFGSKSELEKKPEDFPKQNADTIAKLNQKAKGSNQPLFEKAQFRLFSLPVFDDNGNTNKIKFNTYEAGFKTPAWWKSSENSDYTFGGPNRLGLPRKIVSEDYRKLIPNVVSIKIENLVAHEAHPSHNNNPFTRTNFSFGTLGILDYQIPKNSSYPLKWFFLTNAHVANNLQIANDFHEGKHYGRDFSNYNDSDLRLNTQSITLTKLKQTVPLNTILPTSRNASTGDEFYNTVKLDIKENNGKIYNTGLESPESPGINDQAKVRQKPTQSMNVRTILMGSDVFKFKPSDFSDQQNLQNVDEFLDFAIIEINFNNEAEAKQITEEFYNNHKQNSLKISEFNPFNSDQYLNLEKTPFYSLGYPGSKGDPTISQNDYPADFALKDYSVSPWINKNFRLFNSRNQNDPLINGGSEFAWSRSYRSFVNIPGISDYFISAPVLAKSFTKLDYFDPTDKQRKSKKYLNGGLGTVIDNYTASGGLSGSPVFFRDGQLYSVVYASDSQASANLTLNLRSYGYDYKGYYGKYNLPKYDLIYGDSSSDAQQQKSYWKALSELYKNESDFKTNLFPDGLSKQKDVFAKK